MTTITHTIVIDEAPEDAVIMLKLDQHNQDRLFPVRFAGGGIWVKNGRGPERDGWCFYEQKYPDP